MIGFHLCRYDGTFIHYYGMQSSLQYCEQEIGNRSDPCTVAGNGATLGVTASVVLWHVPCFIR